MVTGKLGLQGSDGGPTAYHVQKTALPSAPPVHLIPSPANPNPPPSTSLNPQDQATIVNGAVPKTPIVGLGNVSFDTNLRSANTQNKVAKEAKAQVDALSATSKQLRHEIVRALSGANRDFRQVVDLAIKSSGADRYTVRHEGHNRRFYAVMLADPEALNQLPASVRDQLFTTLKPYLDALAKEAKTAAVVAQVEPGMAQATGDPDSLAKSAQASKRFQSATAQQAQVTQQKQVASTTLQQAQAAVQTVSQQMTAQMQSLAQNMQSYAQTAGLANMPTSLSAALNESDPVKRTELLSKAMGEMQTWILQQRSQVANDPQKKLALAGVELMFEQVKNSSSIQNAIERGEEIPEQKIQEYEQLQAAVKHEVALIEAYQQAVPGSAAQATARANLFQPRVLPPLSVAADATRPPQTIGTASPNGDVANPSGLSGDGFRRYNQQRDALSDQGVSLALQPPPSKLELPPSASPAQNLSRILNDRAAAYQDIYRRDGDAALGRALQSERKRLLEPLLKYQDGLSKALDTANRTLDEGLKQLKAKSNSPGKTPVRNPVLERLRRELNKSPHPQAFEENYRRLKQDLMQTLADNKRETRQLALAQMIHSFVAAQISQRFSTHQLESQEYQQEKRHVLLQQSSEQLEQALADSLKSTDVTAHSQVSSALTALLAQCCEVTPPLMTHTDAERLMKLLEEQE